MKKILTIIGMLILFAILAMYKQAFFAEHEDRLVSKIVPYSYSHQYFSMETSLFGSKVQDTSGKTLLEDYQQFCREEDKVCIALPHQAWMANWLWIKGVQLAGNHDRADYFTGLYAHLDTISSLQPFWEYPYFFGQLLLPRGRSFETSSYFGSGSDPSWEWAVAYGQKGIDFLCEDGCTDYQLPRALAFNYFYYIGDVEKSAQYFLLASEVPGAPEILAQMPAIVAGRLGEHLGSAVLWYEKFLSMTSDEGRVTSDELRYLRKAVYEYSLYLLEMADLSMPDCGHEINCLQEYGILREIVTVEMGKCGTERGTRVESSRVQCTLLAYGLEEGYISVDGSFVYPLEPEEFVYGWRSDVGSWRIVPIQ